MPEYVHSDDYDKEYIFLDPDDVCKNVLVKMPHKEFQELIEDIKKEGKEVCATIFKRIWAKLKTTDVEKIVGDEPEWEDLMGDIPVFYALRWVLFKKPVPLIRCSDVVEKMKTEGCSWSFKEVK
jgi:predicted CopG family antitoxin